MSDRPVQQLVARDLVKRYGSRAVVDGVSLSVDTGEVGKKIKLASGQILDLCDVAYQYPQRVFKYGLQ